MQRLAPFLSKTSRVRLYTVRSSRVEMERITAWVQKMTRHLFQLSIQCMRDERSRSSAQALRVAMELLYRSDGACYRSEGEWCGAWI